MLKIAICEDNEIFVEIIKNNLKTMLNVPYKLVSFLSGREFLKALSENVCQYNLVFLDIELEDKSISGIDLGQMINSRNPQTQLIFISQYLEYASDVYSTKHTYFINKNRLNDYLADALHAALKNLDTGRKQYLTFKVKQTQLRIPADNILYLERNLRETFIYTGNKTYTTRDKLSELQQQLPSFFVCCHRSFLVNLHAVTSLHHAEIILNNGQGIPVSRAHYDDTKKAFSLLMLR